MSGGGFDVDYDVLEETAGILENLASEFEGMKTEIEGYADAVAHGDLAGNLERAGKNWSDKRKEITEKMQDTAAYGTQASAAYRDLDSGLGDEFSGM